MTRVLVTGATGLIGRYVVARLLRRGFAVRALVRPPTAARAALPGGVEAAPGDVTRPDTVRAAACGVDVVLHLAGCAEPWARDPSVFRRVNVDGVRHVLAAADEHGVRRVVHVSTVLTHPALRGGRPPARGLTAYEASKLAGERLVAAWAAAGGDAVIVHPARVYGPGPLNAANGVTRFVALALRSPAVAVPAGGALASYVHADDVARGILLAAERGARGARYVLGGENASLAGLVALAGEIAGRRPLVVPVPVAVTAALGHLAEAGGRLGLPVPITAGWARALAEDHRVDISAERRALGYNPRPLRAGLEETIRWLCQSWSRRPRRRPAAAPTAPLPS
jgi:nucleoside-diphosphate-sugar epimerase